MQYGKYCLLLRCLILAESPNRARVGKTYIHKGVTVRFGFDVQRTSQLHQYVKNKATGTPHGDVVIYSPLWLWTCLRLEPREFIYYASAWGFQRCSFRHTGQCEGLLNVERVTDWLRASFVYVP